MGLRNPFKSIVVPLIVRAPRSKSIGIATDREIAQLRAALAEPQRDPPWLAALLRHVRNPQGGAS